MCDSSGVIVQTSVCNEIVPPQPQVCPVLCPSGTFFDRILDGENSSKTPADCRDCPSGYYQPGTFTFLCLSCPLGQYVNETRSWACTKCPTGYFQNTFHSKECRACPKGYAAPKVQTTECDSCGSGQYAIKTNMTRCLFCKRGKFKRTAVSVAAVSVKEKKGRRRLGGGGGGGDACIRPTTTGYLVEETNTNENLQMSAFNGGDEWTCDTGNGYTGSVSTSVCNGDGKFYTGTGCTLGSGTLNQECEAATDCDQNQECKDLDTPPKGNNMQCRHQTTACTTNANGKQCYHAYSMDISGVVTGSTSVNSDGSINLSQCTCVCFKGFLGAQCHIFDGSLKTCYSDPDCASNEFCQYGNSGTTSGKCRKEICASYRDCEEDRGQTCNAPAAAKDPGEDSSPTNEDSPGTNEDLSKGGRRQRRLPKDLPKDAPGTNDYNNDNDHNNDDQNNGDYNNNDYYNYGNDIEFDGRPSATTGVCEEGANANKPPEDCIGDWTPCVTNYVTPTKHCRQQFVVTTNEKNGGTCTDRGDFQACQTGACGVPGCDQTLGSGTAYDKCGVCGGADTCDLTRGCDGVYGSGVYYDKCGECGGSGTDWLTCAGGIPMDLSAAGTDSFDCLACPAGQYNNENGRPNCDVCPSGKKSAAGDTSCGECKQGQYRGVTDVGSRCRGCAPGTYTNQEGQPFCLDCGLGKISSRSGAEECQTCATGQYNDESGSNVCKLCAYPESQEPTQPPTACGQGNWKNVESCREDEYLDTSEGSKSTHTCKSCPIGAWCNANMNWTHTWSLGNVSKISGVYESVWKKPAVIPMFGWSRCRNNHSLFKECPWGAACLGSSNERLFGKFKPENKTDPAQTDPARINSVETCAYGYALGSNLCGRCAKGFSHEGLQGKCAKCPDDPVKNRGLIIGGIAGAVVGTFVYIRITLSGAAGNQKKEAEIDHTKRDDQSIAAGVKSIGLTFIQMMTLLSTFPIAWPSIFTSIFQVGGAISALGKHVVNLKCLVPDRSEAQVFYWMGISWAVLPIALVGICELCWLLVYMVPVFKVTKLVRNMRSTAVALLYFLYPDLCTQALAMFSCVDICGQNNGLGFLSADLDEPCYTGEHRTFVLAVAVPMMILYVLGLPIMAFVSIDRIGKRATKQGKIMTEMEDDHFVFGLFYSMFKHDTWWWELTIAGRKVAIAVIGVFGARLGLMQVHLTLAIVVVVILMTAVVAPYGDEPGKQALHLLELLSLVFVWLTLWAGSVFNTYPKCMSQDPANPNMELKWCSYLSLAVGAMDVCCFLVIAIAFIYLSSKPPVQKKMYRCGSAVHYLVCCKCFCKTARITKQQLEELHNIFEQFDTDGSGTIDENELTVALHALKISKTDAEIHTMFSEVDTDHSNSIDFDEFKTMMTSAINSQLARKAKAESRSKRKANLFKIPRPRAISTIPMRDQGANVKHHHHHHHHHHFYNENDELQETKTDRANPIVTDTSLKVAQRKSQFNVMAVLPDKTNKGTLNTPSHELDHEQLLTASLTNRVDIELTALSINIDVDQRSRASSVSSISSISSEDAVSIRARASAGDSDPGSDDEG